VIQRAAMESIFIVLTVFMCPVAIIAVVNHYKLKNRQLQAGVDGGGVNQKLLARCEELEERVQTLETIVCEGDEAAAARMRALAAGAKKALPGKSEA